MHVFFCYAVDIELFSLINSFLQENNVFLLIFPMLYIKENKRYILTNSCEKIQNASFMSHILIQDTLWIYKVKR